MPKIPLTATTLILLLLSPLLAVPVTAHSTLGSLTPAPRYHVDDSDPHVGGPTAYVWPGSGLSSFTGLASGFPPGYQSPFPGGSLLSQPLNLHQLEGDDYSPYGAILASTKRYYSKGPLIFALNFSQPCRFGWNDVDNSCGSGTQYAENFTGLSIYIPPEFDLSALFSGLYQYNPGLIESTFGATADDLTITHANKTDPWGPGWWVVDIYGDIHWWPQHDYREWYYLRINDVVAPRIAGRYFFKIFLQDQFFNFVYPGMPRSLFVTSGECGSCNQGTAGNPNLEIVPYSGPTNATVPVANWPVLLVKGSIAPAIITGTIRYGTVNATIHGRPINLSGRVRAVGTAIDPYRPDQPETGRSVEAMGYFNASAQGHFEVEGLAPGVYDVYASAAGHPEQLIASKTTVLPSQSLHLDGYINPGATVAGTVYSRNEYGQAAWPASPRPIHIEIYRNNGTSGNTLAAFSPLNLTHQPFMAYDWDYFSNHPNLPTPRPIAFPWSAPSFSYYTASFQSPTPNPYYNSHLAIVCGSKVDACGKPNGVGPAQYWWVDGLGRFTNGGGSDGFAFQFGVKGVFGTPTNLDGHVPQSFASWVDGLGAGHYWIRAWVNGFTQTLLDGRTVDQTSFDVPINDWAGDIHVPVYLRSSGSILVTTHFHDHTDSLVDCPISGCAGNFANGLSRGNRYLVAELHDIAGTLVGLNFTQVLSNQTSATLEVNGFGLMGPDIDGIRYSYRIYQGYRDYGILTGTYRLYLYMRGYLQSETVSVSLSLGSLVRIGANMHRGARLNMTLYSVDWQRPRIPRPWEFPGARLRIYILNQATRQSLGYIGYPSFIAAAGGSRADEPYMQPACYTRSAAPPFCPTGSTQVIDPNDPLGSTIVVNEWDGFPGAEVDGVGIYPSVVQYGASYIPPWNLGGFLEVTSDYRLDASGDFGPNDALSTGLYSAHAFTYGYVQTSNYIAFATEGGVGDLRVDLLKGVNMTIYIPMMLEGLNTPTQFNMSMRVRVFDDQGNLVATASTKGPDTANFRNDYGSKDFFGLGRFTGNNLHPVGSVYETYYADPFTPSPSPGINPQQTGSLHTVNEKRSSDTFLWYGSWSTSQDGRYVIGWQAFDSDPNHDGVSDFGTIQFNANYWGFHEWRTSIPYHTQMVRVFLAGIYDVFGDSLDGQNSGTLSSQQWNNSTGEEVNSMHYGIYGSTTGPEGGGKSLTVEVDCWNEYPAPFFPNAGAPPTSNWYPPVEGLLEGDSFHIVRSHAASPFGFTGDTLFSNGLGPYAQERAWTLPNPPFGGETSGIFRLDKRGHIDGTILGFTIDDRLQPVSWAQVEARIANYNLTQYSWDGHYDMYLDPGRYSLLVAVRTPNGSLGYRSIAANVNIASGQTAIGINFQLELNDLPAQKYSNLVLSHAATLVITVPQLRPRSRARKH